MTETSATTVEKLKNLIYMHCRTYYIPVVCESRRKLHGHIESDHKETAAALKLALGKMKLPVGEIPGPDKTLIMVEE